MDPGCAPERIGARHLLDQVFQLRVYRRASWTSTPRLPSPEGAEPLAMPADNGFGPYQVQNIAPARPVPRKVDPEELVEPSEPRPLGALAQEGELLPKRKVLEYQTPARSQGRAERAQQRNHDGPHGRAAWSRSQITVKSQDPILANDTA